MERAEEEWEGAEERGAGCRTQWIGSKCITHLHENGLTVNLYNRDRREAFWKVEEERSNGDGKRGELMSKRSCQLHKMAP